jgi:hypothetical protein
MDAPAMYKKFRDKEDGVIKVVCGRADKKRRTKAKNSIYYLSDAGLEIRLHDRPSDALPS